VLPPTRIAPRGDSPCPPTHSHSLHLIAVHSPTGPLFSPSPLSLSPLCSLLSGACPEPRALHSPLPATLRQLIAYRLAGCRSVEPGRQPVRGTRRRCRVQKKACRPNEQAWKYRPSEGRIAIRPSSWMTLGPCLGSRQACRHRPVALVPEPRLREEQTSLYSDVCHYTHPRIILCS